jgi:hypothetical protein
MNMQEDKFFDVCRESLTGFAPEVPASVYAGVQRKLMWSSFLSFNTTTLNVWYVAAVMGAATAGSIYLSTNEYSGQTLAVESGKSFNVRELVASTVDCQTTASYVEVSNTTTKAKTTSSTKKHTKSVALNPTSPIGSFNNAGEEDPDNPKNNGDGLIIQPAITAEAIETQLPTKHLEFSSRNSVDLNGLLEQLKSDKGEVVIKVHTNK